MEDLQVILSSHRTPSHAQEDARPRKVVPPSSKIPDLFFDEILVEFKLSRPEVLMLMLLYRVTWCRPNLHAKHGIAPMLSHQEVAENLKIPIDTLIDSIRSLESYGFIETIRSGQYFVRRYFTEANDKKYQQTYDDFF